MPPVYPPVDASFLKSFGRLFCAQLLPRSYNPRKTQHSLQPAHAGQSWVRLLGRRLFDPLEAKKRKRCSTVYNRGLTHTTKPRSMLVRTRKVASRAENAGAIPSPAGTRDRGELDESSGLDSRVSNPPREWRWVRNFYRLSETSNPHAGRCSRAVLEGL